jgi:DNA-binding FrmR family transcriptional regulator
MESIELAKRVNRVIGQLKGIQKMADEQRECSDILQQISAIKKAIDGLSKEMVIGNICKFVPADQSKKVEQMVERAINL